MSSLTGKQRLRQVDVKTDIMHRRALRRFMNGLDTILIGGGVVYRENLIKEFERSSSGSVKDHTLQLSREDVDLLRQWFNAVFDLNQDYLEAKDHDLGRRIHEFLDVRVSNAMKTAASSVNNG